MIYYHFQSETYHKEVSRAHGTEFDERLNGENGREEIVPVSQQSSVSRGPESKSPFKNISFNTLSGCNLILH